jgi:hypothetical protein
MKTTKALVRNDDKFLIIRARQSESAKGVKEKASEVGPDKLKELAAARAALVK